MVDGDLSVWFADDRDPSTENRLVEIPIKGRTTRDNWTAEITDGNILAMTNDEKNGRMFMRGHLALRLVNGVEKRPSEMRHGVAEFRRLWQDDKARQQFRDVPDIWSQGGRLRLWYKNPNVAAVWFVELAILSFALVLTRRLIVKAFGVILVLVNLTGLYATSSRGGVVALAAGTFCIAVTTLRLRTIRLRHVLSALAVATVVVSGAFYFDHDSRFTTNFFQQDSHNSRVEIWKSVPAMVAAAPVSGWGIGNSGEAYVMWFQKECTCLLKDMIGSHFTNLVEYNLWGRFLYLFGWCAALICAAAVAFKRRRPVGLGMLAAVGAASVFNPVFRHYELLMLPMACAAVVIYISGKSVWRWAMPVSAIFAVVGLVAVYSVGEILHEDNSVRIVRTDGRLQIGNQPSDICVVDDGFTLNGGFWWQTGHEVREWFAANPQSKGMTWVTDLGDLPSKIKRLVLIGEKTKEFVEAYRTHPDLVEFEELFLLSPNVTLAELPVELRRCRVSIYRGAIAAAAAGELRVKMAGVHTIAGAALYIPNWLKFIL